MKRLKLTILFLVAIVIVLLFIASYQYRMLADEPVATPTEEPTQTLTAEWEIVGEHDEYIGDLPGVAPGHFTIVDVEIVPKSEVPNYGG